MSRYRLCLGALEAYGISRGAAVAARVAARKAIAWGTISSLFLPAILPLPLRFAFCTLEGFLPLEDTRPIRLWKMLLLVSSKEGILVNNIRDIRIAELVNGASSGQVLVPVRPRSVLEAGRSRFLMISQGTTLEFE